MKIDKDLALLFVTNAAFMFEGSDNEDIITSLKQLVLKYEIDLNNLNYDFEYTEENAVKWLETTIDRIQESIDSLNDLEY